MSDTRRSSWAGVDLDVGEHRSDQSTMARCGVVGRLDASLVRAVAPRGKRPVGCDDGGVHRVGQCAPDAGWWGVDRGLCDGDVGDPSLWF